MIKTVKGTIKLNETSDNDILAINDVPVGKHFEEFNRKYVTVTISSEKGMKQFRGECQSCYKTEGHAFPYYDDMVYGAQYINEFYVDGFKGDIIEYLEDSFENKEVEIICESKS